MSNARDWEKELKSLSGLVYSNKDEQYRNFETTELIDFIKELLRQEREKAYKEGYATADPNAYDAERIERNWKAYESTLLNPEQDDE